MKKKFAKFHGYSLFGFRDITIKLVIRPKNPPVMNGVNRIIMTEKKNTREAATAGVL